MIILPPGRYIIADPCYICPEERWSDLLEANKCFKNSDQGSYANEAGEEVVITAFFTFYGDGVYHDQDHNEYGVDAGMISIANADLVDNLSDVQGHVHQFDTPVKCSRDEDGTLHFGHVIIPTGDVFDEDEYESNDYQDEDALF